MQDLAARVRERLSQENGTVTSWSDGPGERYAPHTHEYDKILVALDGSIVFRLAADAMTLELATGDRLDLPAGTVHAAAVGPRGVRCLEAHLAAGALGARPRRMADWVSAAAAGPGQPTDGDGPETVGAGGT